MGVGTEGWVNAQTQRLTDERIDELAARVATIESKLGCDGGDNEELVRAISLIQGHIAMIPENPGGPVLEIRHHQHKP